MNLMLLGAIAMACLVVALFFLRSWRRTSDRFFLFFAASFFIEGLNRAALGLSSDPNEGRPFFYFVRFFSFLLILVAIALKNLKNDGRRLRHRQKDAS
jgi:uncharacterized membrane protein HdeD (DUF308 family)